MNRRSFIKRLAAGIGSVMLCIGLDAFFVEPYRLRKRELTVPVARLPNGFAGFRIAHFSDVHIGHGLTAEDLAPLIDDINSAAPDLIAFTGDLFDDGMEDMRETVQQLKRLDAPYGKYAVLGNHDVRGEGKGEQIIRAYREAGFIPLINERVKLQHHAAQDIIIVAGLDDYWRTPDWDAACGGIPAGACMIVLAHEPDVADQTEQYGAALQLSGHSHGGQVRLPFIGGILYPPCGRKYPDGLQRTESGNMLVHTSRGIGTTILPVRFFCAPEWYVLTLETTTSSG
ncbi:metallophosphoesterase [Aneurinibacillus sp. BA2021]|nr:metallophosphoesterase [Aneurinibacillus sp. BA2021]